MFSLYAFLNFVGRICPLYSVDIHSFLALLYTLIEIYIVIYPQTQYRPLK